MADGHDAVDLEAEPRVASGAGGKESGTFWIWVIAAVSAVALVAAAALVVWWPDNSTLRTNQALDFRSENPLPGEPTGRPVGTGSDQVNPSLSGTGSATTTGPSGGTSSTKSTGRTGSGGATTGGQSGGSGAMNAGGVAFGCPCSMFSTSAVPAELSWPDSRPLEMGVKFTPNVAGQITGLRFYKGAGSLGTHVGTIWSASGTALASGSFTGESPSGWQTLTFAKPLAVAAGTTYVASYYAPNGYYSVTKNYFSADTVTGPLTIPGAGNGVFKYGVGFPTESWLGSNYWVDVIFR